MVRKRKFLNLWNSWWSQVQLNRLDSNLKVIVRFISRTSWVNVLNRSDSNKIALFSAFFTKRINVLFNNLTPIETSTLPKYLMSPKTIQVASHPTFRPLYPPGCVCVTPWSKLYPGGWNYDWIYNQTLFLSHRLLFEIFSSN